VPEPPAPRAGIFFVRAWVDAGGEPVIARIAATSDVARQARVTLVVGHDDLVAALERWLQDLTAD
jgi:hypothetical protein